MPRIMHITRIVGDVYDNDFIRSEQLTLVQLITMLSDTLQMIKWFAKRRLLANSCVCETCHLPCRLHRYSRAKDGWRWSCRQDGFTCSIRKKSFFEGSKLSLMKITTIIFMWSKDSAQNYIAEETCISPTSVGDWCNYLREICSKFIEKNHTDLNISEDDKNPIKVEIGEDKSNHRIYHRGQWLKGAEIMWRERVGDNKFGEILCSIADIYCV